MREAELLGSLGHVAALVKIAAVTVMFGVVAFFFKEELFFVIPILSWLFAKLGFISADFMRRCRRHAVVIILVVAAVITPTSDVFTLLLVAFPMWFLYEISILIVKRLVCEAVG